MSQLFRQQRQAAHEGATNSENVKVHTGLFYLSNRVKCTHLAGLVQPERYTRSGVVGDSELLQLLLLLLQQVFVRGLDIQKTARIRIQMQMLLHSLIQ